MSSEYDAPGAVNPPPANWRDYQPNYTTDVNGERVVDKKANKPFLAWREYKAKEEKKQKEKADKIKRREEKLAKGEPLGPEDELEPEPSVVPFLLRSFMFLASLFFMAGWFVTGDPLWEYQGKWAQLDTYIPGRSTGGSMRVFSEKQLSKYTGSPPGTPIYLAIDGTVYDVTKGEHAYGPGMGYSNFAGVDAARAFAYGCTTGLRTHDLRGLNIGEWAALDHWKKFFEDSPKYPKIGTVYHKPIDPEAPLPGPCPKTKESEPAAGPTKKEEL